MISKSRLPVRCTQTGVRKHSLPLEACLCGARRQGVHTKYSLSPLVGEGKGEGVLT